jgi:hypothetical protein
MVHENRTWLVGVILGSGEMSQLFGEGVATL